MPSRRFDATHAVIREILSRFGQGEEVETAGDSFLIVFTERQRSGGQSRGSAWPWGRGHCGGDQPG